jgi:outer membrane immunogenic protein
MKKIFVIVIFIFSTLAKAESSPEELIPITSRWNGPYLGVNAGYLGSQSDYPFKGKVLDTSINGKGSSKSGGIVGGIQGGYNWELSPQYILGLEGEFSFSDIKDKTTAFSGLPSMGVPAYSVDSNIKNLGALRARMGYAVDEILFFVSAGLAFGTQDMSISSMNAAGKVSNIGSGTQLMTGWTAGLGIEYLVSSNLTLKAEYIYMDFGNTAIFNYKNGTNGKAISAQISDQPRINQIRIGLNYVW